MFTRKEVNLLHDPYFRVIREEENFIEVQSIDTGHCWNVLKVQFEQTNKVTLYHKHKQKDQYYHEHRKCRNVAEAIVQIKNHDDYVLEQEQLKKQREEQVPEQETRHLKAYETGGYNSKPTPTIVLKGEWLKNWGFDAGDKLNIVCEGNGKLTVTAAD